MRIAPILLALALAACATAPPPTPLPASAPAFGQTWYRDAAAAGKTVWQIDSKASLIAVTVRRGGALARLGHDHVVASRMVEGMVAPDDGRADFHFRLDQLRVDDADLRQEAGLMTAPSESAIEGTRTNMLTKVLDAERFPVVELSAVPVAGSAGGLRHSSGADGTSIVLRLRVRLNGTERSVDVPTKIERGPGGLVATGSFTLLQSEFGITPMSVLGGAITVLDQMELRFRLVAGQP
jgi:hypothetical protein